MVFNLQFHWSIRFAINILVLNAPFWLFWKYPFLFWTYKLEERKNERLKSYDQVRMKPWNEIQVMTHEAELVREMIEKEGHPMPLYDRILSDEELKKHGLHSIGRN
ncbi:unnamed protein product [Blepharisma stoltei]|uniref:Uncharacterized protein n=1 Tax=Blepharisma stoltei TaxID=1481888 RepID=A0AAU9IQ84_9CILI|nr:unnamed protein product [Blepharisma stoltei]